VDLIVGNAFESFKGVLSALSPSGNRLEAYATVLISVTLVYSALTAIGVDARKRGDQ